MIRIFIFISIVTLVFSCKEKKPLIIDSSCHKVRFPKIENNLNSFPNTSKKIELTEDSTFIGIWANSRNRSYVRIFFTKNFKLYEKQIELYFFEGKKDIESQEIFEKKILIKDNIQYLVNPSMNSVEESLIKQWAYIIDDDYLYQTSLPTNNFKGGTKRFPKLDSIIQPFTERDAYLDFIELADSNTLAWYLGGSIITRWYKKDNIDYMMFISEGGYECVPIHLKKTRKGYKLSALEGDIYGRYISLDSSKVFAPRNNFKDSLSISTRLKPENYERLIDNRFMYHLYDYKGAYLPD